MDRREFSRLGAAMLVAPPVLLLNGTADGAPQGRPGTGAASVAMGTNLSGMEWAKPGLRYGASSLPNVHFTVPRKAEVAYLAACGYAKNRLPIQWELLQPMLHDIQPSEASRKLIGSPGAAGRLHQAPWGGSVSCPGGRAPSAPPRQSPQATRRACAVRGARPDRKG